MTEAPTLLLVRHGEIDANRTGRWHGTTDSPLTRAGVGQALRLARHIHRHETPVSAVYSSPLQRCAGTAEHIARQLQLDVRTHPELIEYGIGEWEDLPFGTLNAEHDFFTRSRADHAFAPPGGESLREVARRGIGALTMISARHHGADRIVVVAHGALLAVVLAQLVDGDPALWTNYPFDNCSLTELALAPNVVVHRYNQTGHL